MSDARLVRHADTNISATADGTPRPIYLDCAATTPLVPEVLVEIQRYLSVEFGNEGSRTHEYGANARKRVVAARAEVAALARAQPDEVTFTSGATESNNLAILGLADELQARNRMHVVTSAIEHKAILDPVEWLQARGFSVTRVPVDKTGRLRASDVLGAVTDQTGLVTVMHVNNETGVIQPIAEIAEGLSDAVFLHVDAAQGLGKEFELIAHERIDLISGSAHKLHGPKGIGALIGRRRKYRRPPLQPLMAGGGQQRGLRPGTIPVHLVAGYGTAARLALTERVVRKQANATFKRRLLAGLAPLAPIVNGTTDHAVPNMINVSLPDIDGEAALVATKDLVAMSNGSACTSRSYEPSHVLVGMGLGEERTGTSLRMSWSHMTATPDWSAVVERLLPLKP